MEKLSISHERFGWLASAFAVAYLTFAPISGWLVDTIGARRALAGAVLLWSAVAALHATASSFLGLIVLRVALGAAEAPSFPSAVRTVRRALSPPQRSAGFGLLFTGSSFGAMVAAPLAVRVTHDHGFRYAFVVTAIVGMAWLPLWLFVTRPSFAPSHDDASEKPRATPFFELLVHPALQRQAVIIATTAPALAFVLTWYPQYLVEATGVPKDDVGHYVWLPPLIFDAAAVAFGVAASARDAKHGARSHAGLMLLAGGLAATLALAPLFHGPWQRVIVAGLSMAGGAGAYVIGTADLMRRVAPEAIATASGLSASVQSVAQIVSAPIVGAVIDRTHAWWTVLVGLGLLALPGAIAWSLLPSHRPTGASQPTSDPLRLP